MKIFFYLCAAAVVVLFATWTYQVNYDTRAAKKRVAQLQREIAFERETISVLNVEWAYLNRPERLRLLAETYFVELRLMAIHSGNFADRTDVLTADLNMVAPVRQEGN